MKYRGFVVDCKLDKLFRNSTILSAVELPFAIVLTTNMISELIGSKDGMIVADGKVRFTGSKY